MKRCKGINKANHEGCGLEKPIHRFGLCASCFGNWLFSPQGRETLEKTKIKASKKVVVFAKKEAAKKKEQGLRSLMSADRYRADVIQPIFNEIARLIDWGLPCIATGNYGKMAGGHYISVGANRSICLNLHNIHIQSFASNSWKGGDNIKYEQGIISIYGQDYLDFMKSMHQTPLQKWTKETLDEIKEKAVEQRNKLKKEIEEGIVLNPIQRIEKRTEINNIIGIYKNT